MSNDSTKPAAGKPYSTRPGSPGFIAVRSRESLERAVKVTSELGAGQSSSESGNTGSTLVDLVPGGRGAQKPRVFLWEAGAACVRVVGTAENPLFVGKDVCEALGYAKYRDALALLDLDERVSSQVDTLGGAQEMTCVTESGFYALAFGSRKEQARVFRKWVTSEVLPAIRKTGAYSVPSLPAAADLRYHNANLHNRVSQLESELKRALLAPSALRRLDAELEVCGMLMRILGSRSRIVVTAATLASDAQSLSLFATPTGTSIEYRTQSVCARLRPYVNRWLTGFGTCDYYIERHRSSVVRCYILTSRPQYLEVAK